MVILTVFDAVEFFERAVDVVVELEAAVALAGAGRMALGGNATPELAAAAAGPPSAQLGS